MESTTLYRKYRPKTFKEMIGQQHIVKILESSIKDKSFSHAYLFSGPHGVGKTTVARLLAYSIVGKKYTESTTPLDIIEIDAASNRRIDEIRQLKEKVRLTPIESEYKVYIIDEVHMLTKEAFNALLKTLEEPPAHVVFILATTNPEALPATIISRTQKHTFKSYNTSELQQLLSFVCDKEKIKITENEILLVAEHAKGSMRDALSILGRVSGSPGTVQEILGVTPKESVDEILSNFRSGELSLVYGLVDSLISNGQSLRDIVLRLTEEIINSDKSSKDDYNLAKDLLDVKASIEPELSFKVAVAQNIKHDSASTINQEKPNISAGTKEEKEKGEQADTALDQPLDIPDDVQNQEAPSIQDSKATKIGKMSWPSFMNEVRKNDRQTYTMLRMTQPSIEAGVLTLHCKYDLHYKKLNHQEFKSALIKHLEGCEIVEIKVVKNSEIMVDLDKNDPQATVKDIMGGGEVVKLGSTV